MTLNYTTLLSINSEDRTSGSSHNFNINITKTVNLQHLSEIEFYYAYVPITFYNVSSTLNNINFILNEGVTDIPCVITAGNYNVNDFVTAIQALLIANGTLTYSVTFNTITNRLIITNTITQAFF